MSKNKDYVWEVLIKGATCESADIFEKVLEINDLCSKSEITEKEANDKLSELEDRDPEFGLEISVIRKDYKHGYKSYGFGEERKIILWNSCGIVGNEMCTGNIHWCRHVAELLCDNMNKNDM